MRVPSIRRSGVVRAMPSIGGRVITRAGVEFTGAAAPDNHFRSRPDRGHAVVTVWKVVSGRPGVRRSHSRVDRRKRVCEIRRRDLRGEAGPRFAPPSLEGLRLRLEPLILPIEVSGKPFGEIGARQNFRNHLRIIIQSRKEFAQDLRLLAVLCHANHFCLQ